MIIDPNILEQKLKTLRAKAEAAKTEAAKAEATLESLNKQREETLEQIKALGVDPEKIGEVIEQLDGEIAAGLAEAEKLLSEV